MNTVRNLTARLALAGTALIAAPVYATNGMNLDAYGAVAGGMGGASLAYDNGNAAMMNNPATLGLRSEGSRIGLGLTALLPDVKTTMWSAAGGATTVESDGNLYLMPALSYIQKTGRFTYGAGVFAQGGMGTEWGSRLSGGTGLEQRSEIGFGRLMFPLAYNVNDALIVAAQVEHVWGSLDLNMINPKTGDYYSFSNDNDFTGEATGSGWAYKLGLLYRLTPDVAIGATYHSTTNINKVKGSGYVNTPATAADFEVVDPEWPETYGVGMAWQASDTLMLAADIKVLRWSQSLDVFCLKVNGQPACAAGGAPQHWDDQTVYLLGGQYRFARDWSLRMGYNHAASPVPDDTLNPLAPAIVESHFTLGLGWRMDGERQLDFALTYSPSASQTNPNLFGPGVAGEVTHEQITVRLDYDYRF